MHAYGAFGALAALAFTFAVAASPDSTASCKPAEVDAAVNHRMSLSQNFNEDRLNDCYWTQEGMDARIVRAVRLGDVAEIVLLRERAGPRAVDFALVESAHLRRIEDYKAREVVELLGLEASQEAIDVALGWALLNSKWGTADMLIILGAQPTQPGKELFCRAHADERLMPELTRLSGYRATVARCAPKPQQ